MLYWNYDAHFDIFFKYLRILTPTTLFWGISLVGRCYGNSGFFFLVVDNREMAFGRSSGKICLHDCVKKGVGLTTLQSFHHSAQILSHQAAAAPEWYLTYSPNKKKQGKGGRFQYSAQSILFKLKFCWFQACLCNTLLHCCIHLNTYDKQQVSRKCTVAEYFRIHPFTWSVRTEIWGQTVKQYHLPFLVQKWILQKNKVYFHIIWK